jgi:glycosyltransferase involved in cell wall biosynthesis
MTRLRHPSPTRLTVILAHHQAERYLPAAVASVLNQELSRLRLVVVDDRSAGTGFLAALRPFAGDGRLEVYRTTRNVGHYRIKNRVMQDVDTPYVGLQDADDESHPERFARQTALLDRGSADVVGCGFVYVDEDGRELRRRRMPRNANLWLRLGRRFVLHHPTTALRRDVLEALRGFDGTARVAADSDFILRARHLYRLRNVPRVLYRYRVRPGSLMTAADTAPGSALREDYARRMRAREESRRRAPTRAALLPLLAAPPNDVDFELEPVRLG